ncbi:MAG: CDP-glycerol glycerophosphotransferase family protein [Ruminococcaceae bacterium]|nr:CDP-glycerol glycerophosphotransferase family protein [Oscillospiraceae bacterium]
MKILIIKLFVVFIRVLYAFMKLRKTENKIVWLSRQSNEKSEDMKMLSEEISKLSPETKQVFRLCRLENESGLSVSYIFFILRDMWEIASAKIAVTDTYSIPVSCLNHKDSLTVFQIWHALGAVKKFSLQSAGKAQGRDLGVAKAMSMHKNYDFVIAPSEKTAEFYCEAFGCTKDKIIIASLPRVDVISDGKSRYEEFVELNPQYKNKKLIAYFPTFRDNDFLYIKKLFDAFKNNEEYALIVSPHPATKVMDQYSFNGKFSTYDLAKLSDGIISDYSATAIECSLLNKPLWFYVPDYEKYKTEKGLNIEIKDEFSDACFEKEKDLLNAVHNGFYDFDNLKRFSDKFIENKGTDNTEKLASIIYNQL